MHIMSLLYALTFLSSGILAIEIALTAVFHYLRYPELLLYMLLYLVVSKSTMWNFANEICKNLRRKKYEVGEYLDYTSMYKCPNCISIMGVQMSQKTFPVL